MTSREKATATRRKNIELQKKKQEAQILVRDSIMAALVEAIGCEEISTEQKLKAAMLLDSVRKEHY